MGENTEIAWTDNSWNPWQGCHKLSPACDNCYMYRDKKRYGQDPATVVRSAKSTFNAPLKWSDPAKVFICSWSDFFIEEADSWRDEVWDIIRRTPHLTYQIVTKRTHLIKDRLPDDWGNGYPNVWLIATVENQEMANKRIPELLKNPAVVHGISVEPMLGPIDLSSLSLGGGIFLNALSGKQKCYYEFGGMRDIANDYHKLGWVICGGESGPDARPLHPYWARGLRDQCVVTGTPCFFKQWGEWIDGTQKESLSNYTGPLLEPDRLRWMWPDGKTEMVGTDFDRSLNGCVLMARFGKKYTGALLDGQEWRQFPEVT
jgi:protein gp37